MKNLIGIWAFLFVAPNTLAFTWPEKTPEEVGLDSTHIDAAIQQIRSGQVGAIKSLIIIKDGNLITEEYFNSLGEKQPIFSVTKSFGSALLGIADYQGAEIDLSRSILDYLPQYNNISNASEVRRITLHDLLTQRHGYDWDEWSTNFSNPANPVYQMMSTMDWYRTATNWPVVAAPDQRFAYSSGHSSLMSPILNQLTNRDVDEFLQEELLNPLEITDYVWNVFNPRNPNQGLSQYPFGLEPLGFGLWMKPIDLAKLGELFRNGGLWQGNRLLSSDWIAQTVERYSNGNSDPSVFNDEFAGYGYQWWVVRLVDALNRPFDMYYANGFGRQYILVIPGHNTVIVSTATDYNNSEGPGIGTVMVENLLLAFADENQNFPISDALNGSWFDPNTDGQGINIEILNNGSDFLGYWYTYNPTDGGQRWFTMNGRITNGIAEFDITTTNGGEFNGPAMPQRIVWGSGSFTATDCLAATFRFQSELEAIAGEIALSRLTAGPGQCISSKSARSLGPRLW